MTSAVSSSRNATSHSALPPLPPIVEVPSKDLRDQDLQQAQAEKPEDPNDKQVGSPISTYHTSLQTKGSFSAQRNQRPSSPDAFEATAPSGTTGSSPPSEPAAVASPQTLYDLTVQKEKSDRATKTAKAAAMDARYQSPPVAPKPSRAARRQAKIDQKRATARQKMVAKQQELKALRTANAERFKSEVAWLPLPEAMGIFPEFLSSHTTTCVVRGSSGRRGGGSFVMATLDGYGVLGCDGGGPRLFHRNPQAFYSMDGCEKFSMVRARHWYGRAGYRMVNASGHELAVFRRHGDFRYGRMDVSFHNRVCGRPHVVDLEVRSHSTRSEGTYVDVRWSGRPVACIRREFSFRNLFLTNQTYAVDIAPNVDQSLVAAIVLVVDQERERAGDD